MKADGEIIIDTEIRSDGMKEGTREVEGAVRRMAGSVNDLGKKAEVSLQKQVTAFVKLNNAYAAQEKKVKELKAAVEDYGETQIPTQEYEEIQKQIDAAESKLQALQARQERFLETGGRTKSNTYQRMQYDIDELTKTIEYAKGELSDLVESGKGFALGRDTEQFSTMTDKYVSESQKLKSMNENLGASYARIKNEFTEYKNRLLGIDSANKKADKSGRKLNRTFGNAHKSSKKTRKSFGQLLKTMLLYRALRSAVSAAISGAKEGMENLAQYSEETNHAISLLMSQMTQLKNSFATAFSPAIEYAAPALAKLISLLAEAVTWTSQLLAALTGKDTFVKAVEVQQDYAESLDKTADSTEDAAKAAEKALAPFDDLIQIQKSGTKTDMTGKEDTELKPSQMFETVEVSNEAKQLAEDIKKTFAGLFDPIKQSWEENGPTTFESVKNLLSAAKQLAADVGASFMQVWNIEGYGKAITDDLVITFSNLVQAAANLVTQFDLAWTSGNVGTSIIRHLGDIILEFTGFLRQASEDIKNWAGRLDFSPLLKSFDGVLVAIRPIVNDVGNLLLWLLNKVLLPLAKWGIEQGIPKAFDLIAAALSVLHEIIKALEPTATWLWEEFLQPIGEWTGAVIIAALEKIVKWLTKFSDWISKNQKTVETFTIIVLAFFAAWKATEFIVGVTAIIATLTKLSGVLAFLGIDLLSIVSKLAMTALKFGALTLAITGIISVIAILARNWNSMSPTEKVISSILAAAAAVGVLAVALGAVKGAAGAAVVAAALVAGVAAAQIAINAGKRNVASYGGGYGGYSRSSGYPISAYSAIPYQPPMLATGTVVPPRAGISYFGIGDNNHEPEVISPLSTMKQALKEIIEETGMGGDRNITVQMILNDRVFGQAVYKANNQEKQRVGVRMVSQNG